MKNEEKLVFLQEKKESLNLILMESKKCISILQSFDNTPLLFFGDIETHNGVIEDITYNISWIDLKIEELTAIIENTN
jgi:hypothetical protein